ncbi:ROK family transcriptional regulator [Streptacidiphilus sp. P02-A3a]|uniref:ROK family transcriptional regulator n=1 Tax=Streptacidiphilus sp. P02-A3a TaxID=2704468 RepID=UPI0015FAEECD|nr:ROK family transcriptional regulator [Streptacidiphilus sp. P02-A3a]QMU72575.1 ROK family protein [Streptacidiphilus sp. P02-A3a]
MPSVDRHPDERGPASQQGMRRQNLALVLGAVAARAPLSRADAAAVTGLTRAAVSSLVVELMRDGLVVELGPAPSGRVGRPGNALSLSPTGPAGLGLEVGVGQLAACVVDLSGEVRAQARIAVDNRERPAAAVLAELTGLAEGVVAEARRSGLRPVGATLAVPGLVDDGANTVVRAPNLGWSELRLPGTLLGLPLGVQNEANLGALAELWRGGALDVVHVSAEAGIGAALLVGGRLFRGARGFAGELGHVPVHPDGPACACGSHGCLEQYAGERAVLAAAGLDLPPADRIAALARHAAAGEPRVLAALEQAGTALGTALAGAVNLVDPAAVVLGGAYAELGDWLLPGMRRELAARVRVRPWSDEALSVSALGRRGPLLGAALVTIRRILEDPGAPALLGP